MGIHPRKLEKYPVQEIAEPCYEDLFPASGNESHLSSVAQAQESGGRGNVFELRFVLGRLSLTWGHLVTGTVGRGPTIIKTY